MKPSRLEEHLTKIHPDRKDENVYYFQMLKEQHSRCPTLAGMLSVTSKQDSDGLRASYNISLLIAKSGKPHTIGEELVLPAVSEVLCTVLHKPPSNIIKKIPLSNNTVQRQIDEMSEDVESSLTDFLKTAEFSLQLDESTLPNNESLLAYVCFIN
jgi:DNA-directed RNA polymerase subunit L